MSILIYSERISLIDHLIRIKKTGSPQELADRLNISRRILFEYLDEMKGLGATIEYSKKLKSYIYTSEIKFVFGFYSNKFKV